MHYCQFELYLLVAIQKHVKVINSGIITVYLPFAKLMFDHVKIRRHLVMYSSEWEAKALKVGMRPLVVVVMVGWVLDSGSILYSNNFISSQTFH